MTQDVAVLGTGIMGSAMARNLQIPCGPPRSSRWPRSRVPVRSATPANRPYPECG